MRARPVQGEPVSTSERPPAPSSSPGATSKGAASAPRAPYVQGNARSQFNGSVPARLRQRRRSGARGSAPHPPRASGGRRLPHPAADNPGLERAAGAVPGRALPALRGRVWTERRDAAAGPEILQDLQAVGCRGGRAARRTEIRTPGSEAASGRRLRGRTWGKLGCRGENWLGSGMSRARPPQGPQDAALRAQSGRADRQERRGGWGGETGREASGPGS